MVRSLAFLLALAAAVSAETVRFKTADGVEIVADFHAAGKNAPTVICLPMYRHARASYAPLLGPLAKKGFNVCVLDLRGHGESAPELAERVRGRDAAVFNAMHEDVAAAIDFLEREKSCDVTRIGIVGASVGCSVAVDATVRRPHNVRALVLLTPGAKYLGVPTLKHLERWPGTRVFTFCSFEEEKTSKPVVDALDAHKGSNYMFFDQKGIHGTRMFGQVTGAEELIANFMESSLTGGADLRVPQWPAGDPAPGKAGFFARILRPRRKVGETTYGLMTWAVGDRSTFGAIVDRSFVGRVRFKVGEETIEFPFDTGRRGATKVEGKKAAGTDKVPGEQASFRGQAWIVFSLDGLKGATRVVLEFVPGAGEPIRLPAAGHFNAMLTQVKSR